MSVFEIISTYFLHIDQHLFTFVANYGLWTYLILFFIIFSETAFVITPFLPGDSLLFAAGSIAAQPASQLNFKMLFMMLMIAAILGNKLNYLIGRAVGPKIFKVNTSRLFNKHYLNQAHQYYIKHGGKTIVYARFLPIIRTFAPFAAGIAEMNAGQFTFYNILSAFLWVGSLLSAGYYLGVMPLIQRNFSLVIYSIIFITIAPAIIGICYKKLSQKL